MELCAKIGDSHGTAPGAAARALVVQQGAAAGPGGPSSQLAVLKIAL